MLIAAALVPSPPVLVPQLNGADAADTEEVRTAALATCARLGAVTARWTVLGVGAVDAHCPATTRGTFAGFGVDVAVGLGGEPGGPANPELPVAVLVGAWLRGRVAPAAIADARVIDVATPPARCVAVGAALRRELDADPMPRGLLVVADGATTLSERSPGYFHPSATTVQAGLTDALNRADHTALAALDPELCAELGITGRAAYQVLTGAIPRAASTTTDYAAAPFGVAYHVGWWDPHR